MIRNILLAALCLAPCLLFSQTVDSVALRQVDSLIRQADTTENFSEALHLNTLAENIALEKFGRESVVYARCCHSHYALLLTQQETPDQETFSWASEGLRIREKVLGKQHLLYAVSLSHIAYCYLSWEQYEKALPVLLESRQVMENPQNKSHPFYSNILVNLSIAYIRTGQYGQGEEALLTALNHNETQAARDDKKAASILNNLAKLSEVMGDYPKSLQYALQSMERRRKGVGEKHYTYSFSLIALAQAYLRVNNTSKAEELLLEARALIENTVGKESGNYPEVLEHLAEVYFTTRQYEKAASLLREAGDVRSKLEGPEDPGYASTISDLAAVYLEIGALEKAEPLLSEAVRIAHHAVGEYSDQTIQALRRLAALYQMSGRYAASEDLFARLTKTLQFNLGNALHHLSERELQQYLRKEEGIQDGVFSLLYKSDEQQQIPPGISDIAYDNTLFLKGFLLQSAIRARQLVSKDPAHEELLNLLKSCERRLGDAYTKPLARRDSTALATLEAEANEHQKKFARDIAGYAETEQQVNWQAVQKSLHANAATIEFVHFKYYHQSIQFPADSIFYAALLLLPGTDGPKFIPLFEEKQLAALLKIETKPQPAFYNDLYAAGKKGDQLYDLVWKPIAAELPEGATVYCSPSGLLHRLNLGAIPAPDGKTLTEKHRLTTLSSTRSLAEGTKAGSLAEGTKAGSLAEGTKAGSLAEGTKAGSLAEGAKAGQLVVPPPSAANQTATAQLYGGIQYDAMPVLAANTDTKPAVMAARRGPDPLPASPNWGGENDSTLRGENWNYLRWTEVEIGAAAEVMQRNGIVATMKKGAEATEESFKALGEGSPSPRILHVATHGFFFPDPKGEHVNGEQVSGEKTFKVSEHPMIRSGLVLAGANQTWKTGKPARPDLEDGILTAYEISQMNLSNTELAVLSACETGLGDLVGNEGVYGLQRAFKIAGVRYLIMSLWQVPDFQTQVFMTAFYKHWLDGKMAVPEAFRATQSELRAKYGEAFKWAGFVLVE